MSDVWVEAANTLCKVVKATPDQQTWIGEYLSFTDEKAKYARMRMPVWKRGDGKIHMLNAVTQTFPAGFLDQVVKAAAEEDITIKVLDKRHRPAPPDGTAIIDWLRPYQREAIEAAKTASRGIFHMATGGGKTELMVALAEVYPINWLVLTHNKSLIHQTGQRFLSRTGEITGIIGEGQFATRRVTIGTFQSVYAGLRLRKKQVVDYLATVQGVMTDEVHVAAASTYWRVLMSLTNAYYRYGFSGTPFARSDKKSIYVWGATGPIIHRVSADTLIKAGVLAKPTIRMFTMKHAPCEHRTWTEAYGAMISGSKARNRLVLRAAELATKPALLFVNHIGHGRALLAMLTAKGVKTEFVWGTHSISTRKAAVERLVLGETDVLICNIIFQEGIDIPELQSVILAQGGKSMIAALQRVGRGMRRRSKDGEVTKEEFEVYDIRDKGCGCRTPRKHLGCKWVEKHSRHRIAAYASEKYQIVDATNQLVLPLAPRSKSA